MSPGIEISLLPLEEETLEWTERVTKLGHLEKWMVAIRAERFIAANYKVHASEMRALAIAYTFLEYHKIKSTSMQRIVNWSGARRRWKNKMERSIEATIEKGLLLRVKVNSGYTLKFSKRGFAVLRAYEERCLEIEKMMIKEANKNRRVIRQRFRQAA